MSATIAATHRAGAVSDNDSGLIRRFSCNSQYQCTRLWFQRKPRTLRGDKKHSPPNPVPGRQAHQPICNFCILVLEYPPITITTLTGFKCSTDKANLCWSTAASVISLCWDGLHAFSKKPPFSKSFCGFNSAYTFSKSLCCPDYSSTPISSRCPCCRSFACYLYKARAAHSVLPAKSHN